MHNSFRTFFVVVIFGILSGVDNRTVKKPGKEGVNKFTLMLPGIKPDKDEVYMALNIKAPPAYIVGFHPTAHADRVHHMILFGCRQPNKTENIWYGYEICAYPEGKGRILYAWGRNAEEFILPHDTGFSVGHEGDIVQHFVLQMHYAAQFKGDVYDYGSITLDVVAEQPKYIAEIFLFVSAGRIPGNRKMFTTNQSCKFFGNDTIYPFAYRVHTHGFGKVVSAYIYRDGKYIQIGKRSPQWPQIFQRIDKHVEIRPGDIMTGMCRFDTSGHNDEVIIGAHGANEMCNFYMMYYRDASKPKPFEEGQDLCYFNSYQGGNS